MEVLVCVQGSEVQPRDGRILKTVAVGVGQMSGEEPGSGNGRFEDQNIIMAACIKNIRRVRAQRTLGVWGRRMGEVMLARRAR